MDRDNADLVALVKAQVAEKKDEIYMYYAELKLKLPSYLKSLTLKELKASGGTPAPDLILSKNAEDNLKSHADSSRRRLNLDEKLVSLFEQEKIQIISFFRNIKKDIPNEILQKKLSDLEDRTVITKII